MNQAQRRPSHMLIGHRIVHANELIFSYRRCGKGYIGFVGFRRGRHDQRIVTTLYDDAVIGLKRIQPIRHLASRVAPL